MNENSSKKEDRIVGLPVTVRIRSVEGRARSYAVVARIVNEDYWGLIGQIGNTAIEDLNIDHSRIMRVQDEDTSGPEELEIAKLEIAIGSNSVDGNVLLNRKNERSYVFKSLIDKLPYDAISMSLVDSHSQLFPNKGSLSKSLVDKAVENYLPIRYLSETILRLLPEERERTRSSNNLSPEEKDIKYKWLDEVEQSVLNLKAILESRISSEAPIEAEITSWLSRFKAAVEANAGSIVDPENLGNAAVPTAIILACGGLGAIVGGL